MKCPVCKTECGENQKCPECGFDMICPSFINKDEANEWITNIVIPYRKKYWLSLNNEKRSQIVAQMILKDDPSYEFGPKEIEIHMVCFNGDFYHHYHSERADFSKKASNHGYVMCEKNGNEKLNKDCWNAIVGTFWETYLNFKGNDDDFCESKYFILGRGILTFEVILTNGITLSFECWPGSPVLEMINSLDFVFPTNEPANTKRKELNEEEILIW